MKRTARRRPCVHQCSLDQVQIAELADVLHELMPIAAEGELPVAVIGSQRGGKWHRIKTTYGSGWEVVVNFRRNGTVSSTSAKRTLTCRAEARADG